MDKMSRCPYVLDVLCMDGGKKMSIFLASEKLSTLESIKSNFLDGYDVEKLDFNVIRDSKNGLVMPVNMVEKKDGVACNFSCSSCNYYKESKCLGCLHSGLYKGSLW
jgi:hypothetical protein